MTFFLEGGLNRIPVTEKADKAFVTEATELFKNLNNASTDAETGLVRNISNLRRIFEGVAIVEDVNRIKEEIKALEINTQDMRRRLQLQNDQMKAAKTADKAAATTALQKTSKKISENQDKIQKLQASLRTPSQSISYGKFLDGNAAITRKYAADVRAALAEMEAETENDNLINEIRIAINNGFDSFIDRLMSNSFAPKASRVVEDKLSQVSTDNIAIGIKKQLTQALHEIQDGALEVNLALSQLKNTTVRRFKARKRYERVSWKSVGAVYTLKAFRVLSGFGALYLANKSFMQMVKTKVGEVVDIRWFLFFYGLYHLLLDLVLMLVAYVYYRTDPGVVSAGTLLDFLFDTVAVYLLVFASAVWIADIIQDKKYFDYRNNPQKAVNILRDITLWVLVLHGMAPWFYTAGPNFHTMMKNAAK